MLKPLNYTINNNAQGLIRHIIYSKLSENHYKADIEGMINVYNSIFKNTFRQSTMIVTTENLSQQPISDIQLNYCLN